VISAANASQICDGASAVMIASEAAVKAHGLTPLARIHNLTVTAGDPVVMLEEPLFATDRALARSGMRIGDIDLYEVNEAFAPVPLAWLEHVGADPERLNVNGGAIALGHPLGASGAKLMATLVHALAPPRRPLRPPDHVRRRRHRQRHHRGAALGLLPPLILSLSKDCPSSAQGKTGLRQAQPAGSVARGHPSAASAISTSASRPPLRSGSAKRGLARSCLR
jgi:hypothetical protein